MKILLVYSSQTGNTKKLADFLASINNDIELHNISDELDLTEYKNIIIGGWIFKGDLDTKSLEFVRKLSYKNIGFFFTLTAYPTSSHAYQCVSTIKERLSKNNKVIDFFWSQGPISKSLKETIYSYDEGHPSYPDEAKIKRWDISEKHPNEDDFEVARDFLEKYIAKIN